MAILDYREVVWVDVNSNFGEDVDPELVTEIKAINNSLFNIFNCPVGSRPFEREYGSNVLAALFEPADGETATFLDLSIYQAIKRWEPRIRMNLQSSLITRDGDTFVISIVYTILRTSIQSSYDFTIKKV